MYQAKLAGKSRYHFFNAEQDLSVRTYHETLATVRHALSTQALVLHYQPKVNMRTGAVVGVEALIRWQHPEMGLLPPSAFLPLIEGQPLAIEVGEWVMATALEQMEQWKTGGLDMPVSINIGASQIQQASFVEHLAAILRAHPSIPPAALAFEILETTALEDWESVSAVIKNCETLGIRFALDDFGTGYSSLTYLKRLPVASLKIDQTFVHDMRSDPDNLAILVAIIGLANSLHRQIIAEGVESAEQGEMLLQLGCELAQGYFIARPMPAAELPAWVDAWHTDPIWKNRTALGPDHLSLLFASAELRAWIAAVASSLDGKSEAPPAVDSVLCRFGVWLDTVGLARYGDLPAFRVIEPLHRAVHALALELLHSHSHDQEAERAAQRDKLIQLGESLLTHLKNLAEAPSPPQAPIEAEPCLSAKNPAPG
jgi:EAL domain-containing protein (putative c-di-GMP-specific phosphodiesterase class I)